MFMLRGIPFVDLAYLHKRDLQGNTLSYRRRKTGRALTVSLTPEAMQMVRMVADRNPDSPLSVSHPAERGRYGSGIPGIPVGTQGIQPTFGSAPGSVWECSRHSAPMQPDTPGATMAYHCEIHPGIISEAMGHSLHHGDGNLSEAFQQQKD